MRSGVVGIWISLTPRSASASTTAFIAAGIAPSPHAKLGLNVEKAALTTEHFQAPREPTQQLDLF